MSAVLTSENLGLFNSSLDVLGRSGLLGLAQSGQSNTRTYINAATGNLVIQRRDEILIGQGVDTSVSRFYNSLAQFDGDNGDNWRLSLNRSLSFSGTPNTVGSTVTRTAGDGSITVFTYDSSAGAYVSQDGDGAHNWIRYDSANSEWTWTADGGVSREVFDAAGVLRSVFDRDGNETVYAYTAGRLTTITQRGATAADDQVTRIFYEAGSSNIAYIEQESDGATTTRVSYGYDSNNRLESITVDLTPANSSDSAVYVTTYTYDGSSNRVATMTQGDGTSVTFTYQLVDGDYRVSSMTDALGRFTQYNYNLSDINGDYTEIVLATGATTKVYFDTDGYLTRIENPAVNGQRSVLQYAYDGDNNLLSVTDGQGNVTDYTYDARGNRISAQDSAGNRTEWTYTADDQVSSETVYQVADPDGSGPGSASAAATQRWVYDSEGHLRFSVGATGTVTEYTFDAPGNLVAERTYLGASYNLSGLQPGDELDEGQLQTWAGAQDLAQTSLAQFGYDFRGQLESDTRWERTDASGAGIAGTDSVTRFVYDQTGKLVRSIAARGELTVEEDYVQTYGYDGLDRVVSSSGPDGQQLTTVYTDTASGTSVRVQDAEGLVTTSSYDGTGQLLSVAQSNAASADYGRSEFTYTALGQLASVLNSAGGRSYNFYDERARLVFSVDESGAVTQTEYNDQDQVTRQTAFALTLDTTGWYDDATSSFTVSTSDLVSGAFVPGQSAADRSVAYSYDEINRLVSETDGIGQTEYFYDGAGRVVRTETGALNGSVAERVSRTFYDDDGRLVATLDSGGFLTVNDYDDAGRLFSRMAYADAVLTANRESDLGTILAAQNSSVDDQTSYNYYDGRGFLVANVDAEGYLTNLGYDKDGNQVSVSRFATQVAAGDLGSSAPPTVANNARDQVTTFEYDESGRLIRDADYQGLISTYQYDSANNLTRIENFATNGDGTIRRRFLSYDEVGRLTGELDAEQAALLGANPGDAQIDARTATDGVRNIYDAAGRLAEMIDEVGNRSLFFYDSESQLRYSVNARGEVRESIYNAFGEIQTEISYAGRISIAGLNGGAVNGVLTSRVAAIASENSDRRVDYNYNSRGLLTQAVRNALNSSNQVVQVASSMDYDAWGQVVRSASDADFAGSRQIYAEYVYDARGMLVDSIQAAGTEHQSVQTDYDAFGRVISSTDANGRLTTYDYDRLGRNVLVTDPLDREVLTSYDAFGRVLTTEDALNRVTSFQYDDVQRTTTITLPGNIQTVTRTNEFGETVEVIDGENNATEFNYDLNGNLLTTINTVNGQAQSVAQEYDSANRLTLTTDADGRQIRYEYDEANRLLRQITDPDGQALTMVYEYDGLGQRTRTIGSGGRIVDIRFDLDGNVVEQVVDPLGAALTTRFEFDSRGNQLAVIQPTGPSTSTRTEYLYDDLNRLVQEVRDAGPSGLNLTKRYFYDGNGNVVARQDEAGNASFFEYDSANRLRFSVDALGYVTESVYDDLDRVIEKHRYDSPIALPALPDFVDPTSVSINAPQPDLLAAQAAQIAGPMYAAGNVSITGQQRSISFPESVVNPVVIVGPATRNEVDMGVVRVSDIASGSFSIQFQEYDYLDGAHANETVSYMVLEEGRHVLPDGTIWEVGTASISGSGFSTVSFSQAFAGTPRLFVTSQTANEVTPAVVRARNLSANSVQLRMREDEATRGSGHVAETVGYLAIYSPGAAGDIQGNAYTTQSLNATHNAASLDGNINLFVEEEQSANSELNHTTEGIDALQFAGLLFANMTTRAGGDTAGTRIHSLTTAPQIGELSLGTAATPGGKGEHAYIGEPGSTFTTFSVPSLGGAERSSVYYYFDAAGNTRYSIDENRYVTGFTYDDNGRMLTSTRYDNAVDTVALSNIGALEAQVASGGSKTTEIRYDEIGREWLVTDAAGGITEYRYDRSGNLTQTLQYAANTTVTYPMDETLAARVERFFFDASGRQAYVLDDVGNLIAYEYTDSGEISAMHTYGRSIAPGLTAASNAAQVTAALTGAGISSSAADRSTYTFYDGVGRERFSVDGMGRVSEREYDSGGRMFAMRQYDLEAVITPDVTTSTLAEALDTESNRETLYVYDELGRGRFTIDAENRVAETQYDSRGNVARTLRHSAAFAGGPISESALASTYGAASETSARITEHQYDNLNRVERTIDALGQVERYEYDAFGNRTAVINKANVRWEYDYDAAGNLVEERSPTETFYRNGASTSNLSAVTGQLVSRNEYDHLGNVISRTEGIIYDGSYDFSDASETTYDYDSLGRQVGVNYPDLDGSPVSTVTRYDDFGNAVANVDARGNVSYKAYDDLGRERFHVDAEGYVTEYRYDALGNRSSLIRYANQQTILLGSILTTHTEADLVAHMQGAGSSQDRVLTYTYDAAGQLTRITEPAVSTFNPETGATATASPETVLVYNQFGEVVRENRRLSASGEWASNFRYYNDIGQQIAAVDALGYLTTTEYNAFGEAERITEYARALDVATVSEASEPTAPTASNGLDADAPIGADRARRFVFDSLGRVIEEYVADAIYYTYAGIETNTVQEGEIRVLATGYDAVGNVATLTDGVGNTSETRFNALGHAEWSKNPAREILRSVQANATNGINAGATLDQSLVSETPFTSYRYDVFGNVLSVREHATGSGPGDTSVPESANDRVTYFAYNDLRLKSEEVDANGNSTILSYDLAGHVISERRDYQGRSSSNPSQMVTYTAETQYEYDNLGQQITTRVLLGDANQLNYQAVGDQAIEVEYNAFGEIAARGTNRSSFEEAFLYDNAGRVTQALNAQGKPVTYSYDLAGNVTRESSATNGDRVYFYDALGRGVRVDNEIIAQDFSDPNTTHTGSSTVIEYDRWGNVSRQANRSVFWEDLTLPPTQTEQTVHEYHYNRFDQVITEKRPETMIVDTDGSENRGTPIQTYFYDIQGRKIAERDTRGGLRYTYYNSAGQLLEEIDALGNSTRYAHNIFGEQVAKENALGYVTTTEYDRLGQAIRIGDIRFDGNTAGYNQQLITHTYNELGHQVSSTFAHSLEDDGQGGFTTKNVTSFADYDSRGNLVRSQSATGVVVTYAYDSQGRRVLQRNNGIYSSSPYPNRHQLTWSHNYFGQVEAYNDLSGRQFYFDYDAGTGLLERRYQNGETAASQGINYTYYENGALESVDDNELNVFARYEYDAQGRRTYEYVEGQDQRSLIYRQETTSQYDEHGRIARVITTDLEDNLVKMDATYGYDEAGNRRYVRVVSNYDPTFINPTNNAPVVNSGVAAQSVMETQTVSLPLGQNLFSDPDGHALTYSMSVATGSQETVFRRGELVDFWVVNGTEDPPSWMSLAVDAQNRFTLEIDNPPATASSNNSNSSNGTPGQYRIYIQATDEFGKSVTQFFNLQVEDYVEVNLAPVVGTNIPNQSATEGSPFNYAIPASAFSDPNGDSLQYAAYRVTTELVQTQPYPEPDFEMQEVENPLPGWLSFDTQTGTFSGTRNGLTADESLDIRVYAIEQGTAEAYRVAQDFVLTVQAQNDAPAYSSGLAAQYVAQPNTLFDLDLAPSVFTDPNGDTLTYSASGYPSWVTFDAGAIRFSGTPTSANLGVSTVTLTATDPDGASASRTFDLRVNSAPVVSALIPNGSTQATRGYNFDTSGYFSDPDGQQLTFSAAQQINEYIPELGETISYPGPLPSWLTMNANGALSGTPPASEAGRSYEIIVIASDGVNTVQDRFFLNVTPYANVAPVVNTLLANQSVQETGSGTYTFPSNAFTDADGHSLTYTARLSSGALLPSWITFNASQRRFTFNPAYGNAGVYDIRVTANDGNGGTANDVFRLTVSDGPNRAPVLSIPIPNRNATEAVTSYYTVPSNTFYDPDGDGLSYSATFATGGTLPTWISFDPASRLFTFNPAYGNAGTYDIRVTANDGNGGTQSDIFRLTVGAGANRVPTVGTLIGNQVATEGQAFSYTFPAAAFTDPDGDSFTYTAYVVTEELVQTQPYPEPDFELQEVESPLPSWLTFNSSTRTFSGTRNGITVDQVLDIRLYATEVGTSESYRVSQDFTLTVQAANDAPVLSNPPASTYIAAPNAAFSLDLPNNVFTDPNGDSLTYSASGLPSWLSFTASTVRFTGTPSAANIGASTITLTATDPDGASRSTTFTIRVNSAPVVSSAIPNRSTQASRAFSLNVAGNFSDPDGQTLTYTAVQEVTEYIPEIGETFTYNAPLPTWLSLNSNGQFTGTPPASESGRSYTIVVTASDGYSSVQDAFVLNVTPYVNVAPVVNTLLANQTVQETGSGTYTFPSTAFTDADGHSLTYTARLSSGALLPSWITFNASQRRFTFNPAYGNAGIYDIRVTANDGNGGTANDVFRLTVTDGPNRAPVLSIPIPNRNATEAVTSYYTVPSNTFYDPDGDGLSYSARFSTGATLPSWISFNASTRRFTFSPAYGNAGTYDIRVTANDGNGGTQSDVFRLTVGAGANRLPSVGTLIPNLSATEGQAFSYTVPSNAFTDPDGNSFTYTAYVVTEELVQTQPYPEPDFELQEIESPLPSWLTFNSSTRTFSGTRNGITVDQVLDIRLYATEVGTAESYRVSQDFSLTVQAANDAPVLSNPPQSTYIAAPGTAFTLDLPSNVFTDPNGDSLTYSASGLPSWLSFTASTVRFTGTPTSAHIGASTITLTATDPDGASRSTTFTLRVNSAPVVSSYIPNTSTQANRAINLNVASRFSDPDGQTLTFSAVQHVYEYIPELGITIDYQTQLPSWLTLNSNGQFVGTPPATEVGRSYTIIVTASDGISTVQDTFVLNVIAYQNIAPVVNSPLVNQSVQETGSRTYTFPSNAFTDADGNSLTYSARLSNGAFLPSWMSFSSSLRRFTFNPAYGNAGTYDIRVTANDGNGGTVNDVFRVTVTNGPNRAPVVNSAIPNQTAGIGNAFSYTFPVSTFSDADGNSLTYTASTPSWMSFNAGLRRFTGTPTSAGTYNVTVTASDGQYSVSDTFSVTVSASNSAPVLNTPIPNQWVMWPEGLYVASSLYFSDPDGDTLTYTLVNPPSGVYINSSGVIYGLPIDPFTSVTVRASDGQYSVTDTFTVRVEGGGGGRDPFFANAASGAAATESRTLTLDKSESPEAATTEAPALPMAQTNNLFGFGPNNPYEFIEDGYFYNGGYSIYDPAAFISTNTKEYWYTYDAENRITLSEGVLVGGIGGNIEIQARDSQAGVDEQGQIISYDAVGNQVMRIAYNGTTIDADRFVYNTRGELIESQRRTNAAYNVEWLVETARDAAYLDDSLWQSSTEYSYDLAGRTVRQVDYYRPGEYRQIEVISLEEEFGLPEESIPFDQTISIDVSGAVKNATYTTYDDDGRVQSIENRDVGKGYWPSQSIFEEELPTGPGQSVDTSRFLPTEALLITTSRVLYGSDGSNGIPAYTAYDGAGRLEQYTYQKVRRHEGDTDDLSSYNLNYGISYQGFDTYKQSLIFGSGSNENQKNGSTFSTYDDLGRVLTTQESYAAIDQYQKRFFRHNGDGQIINKISGESDSGSGPWTFEPDGTDERHYYFSGGELIGSVDGRGRILFEDQAAYRVVSRDSTSSTQNYSVRQGDTLRSIARLVFGSSSLWYLIADANGLADDSVELVEGQQLKIPGFNSNVNDASAFKAFNAEEIIGDRTPAVPYVPPPPPSKDDGCGIIGQIIVAVVAIVVTVYTAGIASGAAAGSVFSTGTAVVTGQAGLSAAVAGAAFAGGVAGSVASQLVGKALGVVDDFSLRSAFASGLTSAFGAALGPAASFKGVNKVSQGLKVAGSLAVRGAATYLSSQAAQLLTGQDTSFSWRGLAASAAGSVVGAAAAAPFGDPQSFPGRLVQGFASGAAAAVASKALGVTGRVELQAIAVDAFANTVANSIIEAASGLPADGDSSGDDAPVAVTEEQRERVENAPEEERGAVTTEVVGEVLEAQFGPPDSSGYAVGLGPEKWGGRTAQTLSIEFADLERGRLTIDVDRASLDTIVSTAVEAVGGASRTAEFGLLNYHLQEIARNKREEASAAYLEARQIEGYVRAHNASFVYRKPFELTPTMVQNAVIDSNIAQVEAVKGFVRNLPGAIVNAVVQTPAQFIDLSLTARGFIQNEITTFSNERFGTEFEWFNAEDYYVSNVGRYVAEGGTDTGQVLRKTFGENALFIPGAVFYGSYDATTNIREGNYGAAALNTLGVALEFAGVKGIGRAQTAINRSQATARYEASRATNQSSNFSVHTRAEAQVLAQMPVGKIAADNTFFTSKVTFQAPANGTGIRYNVHQQRIDPDLVVTVTNRRTGGTVTTTNGELMRAGNAPYVMKNGSFSRVELHHSRQNAQGPLFEISDITHRTKTGQGGEALHPYKTIRGRSLNGNGSGPTLGQHPFNPVDRPAFNIDRNSYWQWRYEQMMGNSGG